MGVYPQGKYSQRFRPCFSFLIPQIYNRRALTNSSIRDMSYYKKTIPRGRSQHKKNPQKSDVLRGPQNCRIRNFDKVSRRQDL